MDGGAIALSSQKPLAPVTGMLYYIKVIQKIFKSMKQISKCGSRYPSPWRQVKGTRRQTEIVRVPQDIKPELIAIAQILDAAKYPNAKPNKQDKCAVDVVSVLESALAIARQQQEGAA